MDWLTFISSMVSSLAWPLLVLFFFCILWRTAPTWAPFIGQLKYGDIELNFVRKAANVAAASAELVAPSPKIEAAGSALPAATPTVEGETSVSPDVAGEPTVEHTDPATAVTLLDFQNRLQLAETSPTTAVTVAWRMVEQAINVALKISPFHRLKMNGLTKRLVESGHFTDQQISVFQELNRLRNSVIHDGHYEVTHAAAINYIQAAVNLTNSLRADPASHLKSNTL